MAALFAHARPKRDLERRGAAQGEPDYGGTHREIQDFRFALGRKALDENAITPRSPAGASDWRLNWLTQASEEPSRMIRVSSWIAWTFGPGTDTLGSDCFLQIAVSSPAGSGVASDAEALMGTLPA